MTQHELARISRTPQPSIARIERGVVIPRTATLISLLAATGHQLVVEPIGPAPDRNAIRRRLEMPVPRRTRTALGRAATVPGSGPFWILRRLRQHAVPFVLMGELAEVSHGRPAEGVRLIEVCHASTEVAQERVALALEDLTPIDVRRLRLRTETASGDDYEQLSRTAVRLPLDAGVLVRVASIEDLVRARRAQGRPEDEAAAAELRAVAAMADLARPLRT